jgi:hypothetical protein
VPREQILRRPKKPVENNCLAKVRTSERSSLDALEREDRQTKATVMVLGYSNKVGVYALILFGAIVRLGTATVIGLGANVICSSMRFTGTNDGAKHTPGKDENKHGSG